jgi:DNA-binding NarL/FixJ family response regulator
VIRVLVADDFPLVREALVAALTRHPDIEVVGVAEDGVEALEKSHELNPDVVVLDVRMPAMSGRAALTRLTAELPGVRVLLLTAHEEPDIVIDAVSSGAAGFLLKRVSGSQLAEAVVAVHRGEAVITPELTSHLLRGLRREGEPGHVSSSAESLTPSEVKVLRLVADGQSDKQIGEALSISPRTVQSHLVQIRAKVGLRRRVELTRWAAEHLTTPRAI